MPSNFGINDPANKTQQKSESDQRLKDDETSDAFLDKGDENNNLEFSIQETDIKQTKATMILSPNRKR